VELIRQLYHKAALIHADFSEYNILFHQNTCHILDFGQAIHVGHPNAQRWVNRELLLGGGLHFKRMSDCLFGQKGNGLLLTFVWPFFDGKNQ